MLPKTPRSLHLKERKRKEKDTSSIKCVRDLQSVTFNLCTTTVQKQGINV